MKHTVCQSGKIISDQVHFTDQSTCVLIAPYGETLSSSPIVMSSTAEILEDHSFLMLDLLLKKKKTVLTTFVHSLQKPLLASFSKHASMPIVEM